MKLIKLSDKHYIVVSDEEIKKDNFFLDLRDSPDLYNEDIYRCYKPLEILFANKIGKKIIASTQTLEGVQTISLNEIKELISMPDIYKIATKATDNWVYWTNSVHKVYFRAGYTQALEDNKQKQFTYQDLELMFSAGILIGLFDEKKEDYTEEFKEVFQKKLSKTEWNVEFIDGKLKLI